MKVIQDVDGNLVKFLADIVEETVKAIKLEYGSTIEWIPKSQIEEITYVEEKLVRVIIPEWLAYEKEFI